jgi:hypothetical protein
MREQHVFGASTRLYVLVITAFLAAVGVAMCYCALALFSCDVTPFIAYGYAGLAPMLTLTSLLGFYGAFRVKSDIVKQKDEAATEDECDGLATTGQTILTVYFHTSLVVCIIWCVLHDPAKTCMARQCPTISRSLLVSESANFRCFLSY